MADLNGMEIAAVDVEMDIPTVEIRGAGFPYLYLRMYGLYGFPGLRSAEQSATSVNRWPLICASCLSIL